MKYINSLHLRDTKHITLQKWPPFLMALIMRSERAGVSVGVNGVLVQTCSRSISQQDVWMRASDRACGHKRWERERVSVCQIHWVNQRSGHISERVYCVSRPDAHSSTHTDLTKPLTVTKRIIRGIRENTFSRTAHTYCIRKKLAGKRNH